MRRFITLVYLILINMSICALNVYQKTMPSWHSLQVPSIISDPKLPDRFKSLRLNGTSIPPNIEKSITTMVSNPVGKIIIANIVAALEPRKKYIDTLHQIADQIGYAISMGNHAEAVKIAMCLLNFIHSKSSPGVAFDPLNTLIASSALANMGSALLDGLKNFPEPIILPSYTSKDVPSGPSGQQTLALTLLDRLNRTIVILEGELDSLRFQFNNDGNYYNNKTRTISITDTNVKASIISGPKLLTCATTVGYLTQYDDILPDERLCHEILHYFHITLNKEFLGDIQSIGFSLVNICHFDPSYTCMLSNIWSNHEELRTITGLFEVNGQLYFDQYNESSYLATKGQKLRCSHILSYCTKVPAYFWEFMYDCLWNRTKAEINHSIHAYFRLFNDYGVPYVKQIDNLI